MYIHYHSGLGSPEGVAIDWIGRNIYWTDSESDSIEVANLDGLNHKVLVEDVKNPRAIVMDPVAGYAMHFILHIIFYICKEVLKKGHIN